MDLPYLQQICGLIQTYSKYDSISEIAKRLGISPRTLTGYWENFGGVVPDKNLDRFTGLIKEIVPILLTDDAALSLLRGSPLALHNVLLPIEGNSWRNLIDEHVAHTRLEVMIPPGPTIGFGFGEVDDDDVKVADATVMMKKPFRFKGWAKSSGEGFLAAEHRGEWRLIPLGGDQRSFKFEAGNVFVPPATNARARFLREREKAGYYFYVFFGLPGALHEALRHSIHRTNPFSQLDLDLLGSLILQSEKSTRVVMAASVRVSEEDD